MHRIRSYLIIFIAITLSACNIPVRDRPLDASVVEYADRNIDLRDLHSSYMALMPLMSDNPADSIFIRPIEDSLCSAIKGEYPAMKIREQSSVRNLLIGNNLLLDYTTASRNLDSASRKDSALFYKIGSATKSFYLLTSRINKNPYEVHSSLIDVSKGEVVWKCIGISQNQEDKNWDMYQRIAVAVHGIAIRLGKDKDAIKIKETEVKPIAEQFWSGVLSVLTFMLYVIIFIFKILALLITSYHPGAH